MKNSSPVESISKEPLSNIRLVITPLLTFIIGSILTLSVFSLVRNWEQSELKSSFELSARNRLAGLQLDIIRHQELVNSLASFVTSSDKLTRQSFRSFVKDALSRHPDIQGFSWNPLIKHAERESYRLQAVADGYTDFKITELNASGEAINAPPGGDYVAVYYIEPYAGNEKALGFNIASIPSRHQAIERARDSGEAKITERIKLVQSSGESFGYLLLKATYQPGKALDTIENRRKYFSGVAVGVFSFQNWLHISSQSESASDIDVWIMDKTEAAGNQFLHFDPSSSRTEAYQPTYEELLEAANGLYWSTTLEILGREWSYMFTPSPAYLQGKRDLQSWLVLLAGLFVSGLLALYLFSRNLHTARMATTNISLLEEISRREIHESELKAQRDFTDTVLNAASDIVVVLDLYGRIIHFNRAAELLTGYSTDEVLGKVVWDLVIPAEQIEAVKQVFSNLRNSEFKIINQYENEWQTRNGERRLLKWHNSVLFDEDKKVSHIVAMGYDITDQKKAEAKQDQLQRELQQAQKMESLGQLTGGIAHDFNNLLGIINGYASLMADKKLQKDEAKLESYVGHIKEAGDRAAKLVAQMLAFSRSEQSADTTIQLAPLFKEDVEMLRATLPSTIEIETEVEENLPGVLLNPVHLHQILMNLSINARDAMQGIGKLNIKLGWARNLNTESQVSHRPIKGDWIELSISDTGSGIDGEMAKNIFNPFFTTKDVGKGTGMGLSVIYGIMKNHGGHILLESELNKGSTFRMLFPPVYENDIESADSQSHVEPPEGKGNEILVVDDEASLGNFMVDYLNNHGYAAFYVEDSTQALALYKQQPERFSMLITDFTMPKLTGVELIKHLRAIRPDIPVILCTGYSESFDAKMAADMDITYFDKPVDGEKILLKIAEMLGKAS